MKPGLKVLTKETEELGTGLVFTKGLFMCNHRSPWGYFPTALQKEKLWP